MVYRWEDLRDDHLEVEWGENLHGHRTGRRARGYWKKKDNLTSKVIVAVSTVMAIGIATLVALTLVKSPVPDSNENPSSAVDTTPVIQIEHIMSNSTSVEPSTEPTFRPTYEPSRSPTSTPTSPPTLADSHMPSMMNSALPSDASSQYPSISSSPSASASDLPSTSMSPSGIPKAPPAPEPEPTSGPMIESTGGPTHGPTLAPTKKPTHGPTHAPSKEPTRKPTTGPTIEPTERKLCIDQPGFFQNHVGDKVSCDWFSTVGTYNYYKNCGNTDIGKACLLTCKDYNGCIVQTDKPTDNPTSSPIVLSSAMPSAMPTPEPPKSITLVAMGDATLKQSLPKSNLGLSSWLHIDGASTPLPQDPPGSTASGAFHVLYRFDLEKHDAKRPIQSAVLRLKAANDCASGGYLQRTHNPHWDESTVTWASSPGGDGIELGRFGIIRSGYWYSLDVTLAMKHGHRALSLRQYPVSTDACIFVSKDNPSGGGPELHIAYE